LREETNIEVNATELQKLYSGRIKTAHGLTYRAEAYGLSLKNKPKLTRQKLELTHIEWINKNKLLEDHRTADDVRSLIKAFYAKINSG
ncbi:MAG: hypothetical protein ACRD4B_00825, partial [Acidobacteriota bacterium]